MGISRIVGKKSTLKKQNIKYACLVAVFNLPMSTVAIIEDLVMGAMAIVVLIIKT